MTGTLPASCVLIAPIISAWSATRFARAAIRWSSNSHAASSGSASGSTSTAGCSITGGASAGVARGPRANWVPSEVVDHTPEGRVGPCSVGLAISLSVGGDALHRVDARAMRGRDHAHAWAILPAQID